MKIKTLIAVNVLFVCLASCFIFNDEQSCSKQEYQSPFSYNVGIDFSVNNCNWYFDSSIIYNPSKRAQYAADRLGVITNDFKLVRIYSMLIAGWESTGDLSTEASALSIVMNEDASIEAIIGTSCSREWFSVQANTDKWVDTLYSNFPCSKVKCILICNEVNCNGYDAKTLKEVYVNFKNSLKKKGLTIPVTVSFNLLPTQKGLPSSDEMVGVIVNGWDSSWNNGNPFVFVDPYPDGVGGTQNIFEYVHDVETYYRSKYSNLSIYITETGAEGSTSSKETVDTLNAIISLLDEQYSNGKITTPMLFFEATDEQRKTGEPNQANMGLYKDTTAAFGKYIQLKSGLNYKSWFREKITR
jgi:hypothetical protein